MGVPDTESPFFRYLLIAAGNSSHKAGDNNARQDRVQKQHKRDATEGEYQPPELERTKTITAVYQQLIIAGWTLCSGHSRSHNVSSYQLRSYHPPIPAGRHASRVPFRFTLPQTMGFATFIEDLHDLDK
jgi:hypothetical protein